MSSKTTEKPATPSAARLEATTEATPEAAAAARRRAAAYLDLWERHLVRLAAEGANAPRRSGLRRR